MVAPRRAGQSLKVARYLKGERRPPDPDLEIDAHQGVILRQQPDQARHQARLDEMLDEMLDQPEHQVPDDAADQSHSPFIDSACRGHPCDRARPGVNRAVNTPPSRPMWPRSSVRRSAPTMLRGGSSPDGTAASQA